MPARPEVLHVLGGAFAGSAHVRIVEALEQRLADRFKMSTLFVAGTWPEVEMREGIGVASRTVTLLRRSDLRGAVQAAAYIRSRNPAIMHFHVGGGRRLMLARVVRGLKTVVHLHGAHDDHAKPIDIERAAAGADAVIAASQALADRVSMPARVVYTGVRVAEPTVSASTAIVGAAARFWPVKGLPTLIKALPTILTRHPEATLELAGDGPEMPRLRALAAELKISESVRFLGWCDPATVMPRWAVFAIPSVQEGLPLAALEAMAAGLPVVASNVGGLPEVVEDSATGFLVPAGDPARLAERIEWLLADPELRTEMGEQGKQRVRSRFSEEEMARQIADVYDELLASEKR